MAVREPGMGFLFLLPMIVALTVCAAGGTGEKVRRLPTGTWGGNHVGMEVADAGAKLDYDCASGSIDEPILLDESGRLDVGGTHVKEGPGPTRPGGLRGEPARYTGRVEGDTLTLTVKLAGSGEEIGTYTLVRGRFPRIRKCG